MDSDIDLFDVPYESSTDIDEQRNRSDIDLFDIPYESNTDEIEDQLNRTEKEEKIDLNLSSQHCSIMYENIRSSTPLTTKDTEGNETAADDGYDGDQDTIDISTDEEPEKIDIVAPLLTLDDSIFNQSFDR